MRKVSLAALRERWGPERARLFSPPVDLISLTAMKMRRERAKRFLLVSDRGEDGDALDATGAFNRQPILRVESGERERGVVGKATRTP